MDADKEVLPVNQQSLHEAAHILGLAFSDEPISQAIYPNITLEERASNLTADFLSDLDNCLRYGYPLQITESGKIVAAAAIYPPGKYPLPWYEQTRFIVRSFFNHRRRSLHLFWSWARDADKIHPRKAHYYIDTLGVLPGLQGKGYGSAILRHVSALADSENVGCYLLTATTQAVPLYQRHGFQIIREKEIIGVPVWFMWRPELKGDDISNCKIV